MKNFEVRCPVDGSSALQPEFRPVLASAEAGTVIAFPGSPARAARITSRHALAHRIPTCGSLRGSSYDRIKPWQAAVVGCAFSALALVCVLAGS